MQRSSIAFAVIVARVWAGVLACSLAASSPVIAAPATVKVFEGTARERPDPTAPVLKTFPEDTDLSVSEEVTDGWRRVRLPDGAVAYMKDDELELETSAPAPRPAAVVRRPSLPDREPILYIKNLDHLAEVVRSDNKVHDMVASLQTGRSAGIGAVVGGGVVMAVMMAGAGTVYAHDSCYVTGTFSGPNATPMEQSFCSKQWNEPLLAGAVIAALTGSIVGFLFWPKRNDLLDVINTWNRRHVDSPITITPGVAARGD